MLFFILPPIVIVIGITLITVIVSRKSDELSDLKQKEIASGIQAANKMIFFKKIIFGISNLNLKILERLVQRFKILSLRFHNLCGRWFQYIKERKAKKIKPVAIDQETPAEEEAPEVDPEGAAKKIRLNYFDEVREVKKNKPVFEEMEVEPMVSRNVIHPDSMSAAKSKFEEILIERIASNPRDIEAYERLGEYYLERKACDDAKECFCQVIKLSPRHYKAKLKLRRLEKMMKDE